MFRDKKRLLYFLEKGFKEVPWTPETVCRPLFMSKYKASLEALQVHALINGAVSDMLGNRFCAMIVNRNDSYAAGIDIIRKFLQE